MIVPQIEMQVVDKTPEIPEKLKKTMAGLYGGLIATALIIFIFSAMVAFQEQKITEFIFFLLPILGAIGVAIYGFIDIYAKENSLKKKKIFLNHIYLVKIIQTHVYFLPKNVYFLTLVHFWRFFFFFFACVYQKKAVPLSPQL